MRLRLSGLQPGQQYAIRLRSNDGESVSKWSRVFTVTTIDDTIAPAVPGDFTFVRKGTSFLAKWSEVTTNSDSTSIKDFSHYEVVFTAGATSVVYKTKQLRMDLPFENNVAAFITPQATVECKVAAVDRTGNSSGYTTPITEINPAPLAPANLTAIPGIEMVSLKWDNPTEFDVVQFDVYAYPDDGTSAGDADYIASTKGNHFSFTSEDNVKWDFRVAAVDVFGSATYSYIQSAPLRVEDRIKELGSDISITGQMTAKNAAGQDILSFGGLGLITYDESGQPKTSVSADPAQSDLFYGDANLRHVDVSGGTNLGGQTTIPPASKITLGTEMAGPTTPPTSVPTWPLVNINFPNSIKPTDRLGLAYQSSTVAYTVEKTSMATKNYLVVFNPTTGVYTGRWLFTGAPTAGDIQGLGYSENRTQIYTLENASGWRVRKYTFDGTTLAYVSEVVTPELSTTGPSPSLSVGLYLPGVERCRLAQSDTSGVVSVFIYDLDVVHQSTLVTDLVLPAGHREIAANVANLGVHMIIPRAATAEGTILIDGSGVWSGTPGTIIGYMPLAFGDLAPTGATRPLTDPDDFIYVLSCSGNTMSMHLNPFETPFQWGEYSYTDSATGNETETSPPTKFTKVSGSHTFITGGVLPPGADCISVYFGVGTIVDTDPPPAYTGFFRQGISTPGSGANGIIVGAGVFDNSDGLHPNPLLVGDLPASGDPGALTAGDGVDLIRGDYTGWLIDYIDAVAGGGGGGSVLGGVDIDCGDSLASGVEIDCGGA